MKLIGITGFIGSGKTTVGNIIRDMGYHVSDMDVWCKNLYKKTEFLELIKKQFPDCFENNIFYKKKLRNIVFSNREQLQKLENLTHPYLKKELMNFIHQRCFDNYLFFVETALLYQMNLEKFFYKVIITHAPHEVILKRTLQRDHITTTEFNNIIKRQYMNLYSHKNIYKINTDKSFNCLQADVIELVERILND